MKLSELEPRWLTAEVFVFRCPACTGGLGMLSLKSVAMSVNDQVALFEQHLGDRATYVHPCKAGQSWKFSGTDFATITVSPSLNVEGHWHKTITNGEFL